MAKLSAYTIAVMLAVACVAMLIPTGLAQLRTVPPIQIPGLLPPLLGADKCWNSLSSIPGCLQEIYGSFSRGQIGKVAPSCCGAINQVSDNCWPKMFPLNPFLPSLLKNFCAAPSPEAKNAASSKVYLPRLLPAPEIAECRSSFTNAERCVLELLTTGPISGIGPGCCKVVTEINDKCWPKIFPFNPLLPPLLKSTCAEVVRNAPAPKAV